MKKILALVLAVLMMATVAFAGPVQCWITPGASIKIDLDGTINKLYQKEDILETEIYGDRVAKSTGGVFTTGKELSAKNFSLTNIKYPAGKDLVESVKIDDESNTVVIKLKKDYKMEQKKVLNVEYKLNEKGKAASRTYKLVDTAATGTEELVTKLTVGYPVEPANLTGGAITLAPPTENTIYKVTKTTDYTYGTMDLNVGDASVNVRVYDGEKYYLDSNVDANTAVLKANADVDANFRFLNFPGAPTFNATATIYFYGADEKEDTIYQVGDKGALAKVGKYDTDAGCWVVKTRTLGNYVVSDKALKTAAVADADKNPDTGANDVVGIATALAAVALVSAAAVSLKK